MVKSVTQTPMKSIANLHCGGAIDVDLTFGQGGIYLKTDILPWIRIDKRKGGNIVADIRFGVPLPPLSVDSVVFDPPFIVRRNWRLKKHWIFDKYTAYDCVDEGIAFLTCGIAEAHRILRKKGKLVVKIQNCSLGDGRTFWASQKVFQLALELGFTAIDQIIEVSPVPKPMPASVKVQKSARKIHCTWWVFKKL